MASKKPAKKKKKAVSTARRRPRPRPIWMQLGPPSWLQNSPGFWIQVTFVRSLGRTVEVEVKQEGASAPSRIAMALSHTKKRLKKSK